MPSPRINIYVQSNFVVGERKTSLSFDQGTSSSVQELVNYRVLKSGSIKRRSGTREEFQITGSLNARSEILKFLEFADGFVVLARFSDEVKLYFIASTGNSVELVPSAYRAVVYSLEAIREIPIPTSTPTPINPPPYIPISSYTEVLATKDTRPLVLRDIEELGKSIFLLFETGLPYRLFIEGQRVYIAPYFYKTDMGAGYEEFIRSLPISDTPAIFSDTFFASDGSEANASDISLTIGSENLDTGTCIAFLSLSGSLDVPSTVVDTSKMALKEYLFKPFIFNVIPSEPEVIDVDVGSRYTRTGTAEDGTPTATLAYLADWNLESTYSKSELLTNLNEVCSIHDYSYNPVINSSAAASVGDSEAVISSKAQLIRELLYGRKYMIIPYEVVGVDEEAQSTTQTYHTALEPSTIAEEAVTVTEVNVDVLATGLSRANEGNFFKLTVSNYTLNSSSGSFVKGTVTRAISGLDDPRARAGYSMLRVDFPEEYVQFIDGIRGTKLNELPWSQVVLGDWLNFLGVGFSRGATGATEAEVLNRNVRVTLYSGLLADSTNVFKDITRILVSRPGTFVTNNSRASSSIISFSSSSRASRTATTREFRYDGGGSRTVRHPDLVTQVRDTISSYSREASLTNLKPEFVSPIRDSSGNVKQFIGVWGRSRTYYMAAFNIEDRSSLKVTRADRVITLYTAAHDSTPREIWAIQAPLSETYIVYDLRDIGYVYAPLRGVLANAQLLGLSSSEGTLPTPRTSNNVPAPLTSLDGTGASDRYVQGSSDTEYIYMLFRVARSTTRYYMCLYRESGGGRLSLNAKRTISWRSEYGSIQGFSVAANGEITLASADRLYVTNVNIRRSNVRVSDISRERTHSVGDISVHDIIEFYKSSTRKLIAYHQFDNAVTRYGETFGSSTVRTSVPNEEVSILRDFFSSGEGTSKLNITLVRRSGFQGFEVVPYNIATNAAFGFSSVSNNEYISDNRHATGPFDFPVLDIAGSASISLGSITAFGRHIIATAEGEFFTWFTHVRKGGTLSDINTIYMRIGGAAGSTYTLHKQSVAALTGNVEVYIESVRDFSRNAVRDRVIDIPSPVTIEFFSGPRNTLPFTYASTKFNDRIARVYANCLIFEIGMPSTARKNGVRVVGGNNYELGYTSAKVVYSTDDYNYTAFTTFNNNFNLIRDDSVSYFYQNENKANHLLRTLTGAPSAEIKDLFVKSQYIPGTFDGKFPIIIPLYLLSSSSRASYVIASNSRQSETFDNYIRRAGFRSQVSYLKRVVNPRGRSVKLNSAVSSFDGEGILVASDEGLYNVPVDPVKGASLVHNQRFKFKPLVFHNRFVFISPDNLMITQVRSRERLGLKSNYSGADQMSLLSPVLDIVFDQDSQVYMMPDSAGDIVVATDFDTNVAGFAKWKFADDVRCLKLLPSSKGVKGIFKKGDDLVLVTFDDSIVEDFKIGDDIGSPFTSRLVSNSLIASDNADTGLFRGHVKKIQIDYSLCSQIKVEFVADNTISVEYDYVKQDSKGVNLAYNQPLDSGGGVLGYNPRVILSQRDIDDCDGVIYGFKYTGVLDGF